MLPTRRSGPLRALLPAALAAVVALSGCTGDVDGGDRGDGAAPDGASASRRSEGTSAGEVVLVLPPSDALAGPAADELRRVVAGAVAQRDGDAFGWEVLEPATAASLADTVEIAIRRTGGDGTVCVVGTRGRALLVASLARYPAVRICVVPGPAPTGVPEGRVAIGDVDLARLGRELGAAARAAAGPGSVLLVDSGDGLLDVRWRRGVEEGVLGSAGGSGPTLGVVTTAAQALALLDEQAALVADGIVPGGPGAAASGDGAMLPEGRDGVPPADLLPTARSLLPVAVVVLDAGPESAALAAQLAERGVPVVAPRVLVDAGIVRREDVVVHWRVRWDSALLTALAEGAATPDPTSEGPTSDDLFVLVTGPAAIRP